MKIAGVVILYKPPLEVLKNISTYKKEVEKLYIVDNSVHKSKEIIKEFEKANDFLYLNDKENWGIAKRLNQVIQLAIEENFDWLLTMDQDSNFDKNGLAFYLNCCHGFNGRDNVSMFGVNFSERVEKTINCSFKAVHHLITSGSLLNLNLFPEIGNFDENLFIDEVDFEYCLRSISKGFQVVQFENIYLNHNLGQTSILRSFKTNKKSQRVLHSAERLYYMTRNFFYVRSLYKTKFPEEIQERKAVLLNRIKNNLFYNKRKVRTLRLIIKGYFDYRKRRMGKL
ncbi:MAG TPA: glycosyltransferase [Hanamia sp.]|nr:glycosyltransferase [Hanamia sp.]